MAEGYRYEGVDPAKEGSDITAVRFGEIFFKYPKRLPMELKYPHCFCFYVPRKYRHVPLKARYRKELERREKRIKAKWDRVFDNIFRNDPIAEALLTGRLTVKQPRMNMKITGISVEEPFNYGEPAQ